MSIASPERGRRSQASRVFGVWIVLLTLVTVGGVGAGRLLRQHFASSAATPEKHSSAVEATSGRATIAVEAQSRASDSTYSPAHGEIVFQLHCAKCHGPDGHGDPEALERLRPPPRDFAARPWRFAVDAETIRRVTSAGINGTAMPAFQAALSSRELEAVVAHTLRLATTGTSTTTTRTSRDELLVKAGFTPVTRPRTAPFLKLTTADGRTRSLSDEQGRLVLLNFWGTTCEHCLAGMPKLNALSRQWEARGVTILSVCADAEDAGMAEEAAHRVAPGMTVWIDATGLAVEQFEAQILPTTWLIGVEGQLLGVARGMRDWDSPALGELLKQAPER